MKFEERELQCLEKYLTLKQEIHAALCDSIDTHTVIEKMRKIIEMGNIYIKDKVSVNF